MNKKSAFTLLSFIFIIVSATAFALDQGESEIVLNGGPKGDIQFPHHLHQAVVDDCMTCHKDFEKSPGSLDAQKQAGILEKKQVMNKTCLKCHREMKKANVKSGPVSCNDCHKK